MLASVKPSMLVALSAVALLSTRPHKSNLKSFCKSVDYAALDSTPYWINLQRRKSVVREVKSAPMLRHEQDYAILCTTSRPGS
eukprot:scaffold146396_cov73-Cyclotella_meneghiniana.AAC.2